jgi:hypothetical protein
VKPGITGWAQIHGRHLLEWSERFTLDVWYVDNWSLRLDLRILLATVSYVVRGTGLAPMGSSQEYWFLGNPGQSQPPSDAPAADSRTAAPSVADAATESGG